MINLPDIEYSESNERKLELNSKSNINSLISKSISCFSTLNNINQSKFSKINNNNNYYDIKNQRTIKDFNLPVESKFDKNYSNKTSLSNYLLKNRYQNKKPVSNNNLWNRILENLIEENSEDNESNNNSNSCSSSESEEYESIKMYHEDASNTSTHYNTCNKEEFSSENFEITSENLNETTEAKRKYITNELSIVPNFFENLQNNENNNSKNDSKDIKNLHNTDNLVLLNKKRTKLDYINYQNEKNIYHNPFDDNQIEPIKSDLNLLQNNNKINSGIFQQNENKSSYISQISSMLNDDDSFEYSKVKKVEIPFDSNTNALKSYAIVEFEELKEAQNAWVYFDES